MLTNAWWMGCWHPLDLASARRECGWTSCDTRTPTVTSGDEFRPLAWKYRDYVIRAFNSDKPFDRFVLEQLAGDELVESPPKKTPTKPTH